MHIRKSSAISQNIAGFCAVLLCTAQLLQAQSTLGTITGLVTDSSGAVVPSAVVVALNTGTGVRAQTVGSSTGNYVIPNLQVGVYDVTISVTGFKTFVRPGVSLRSNDTIRVDAALEIGAASERVEISAATPPLKTESTEVSSTMEGKLVNDVPLAVAGIGGGMRNAFSIMMMMPQVKRIGGGQQHDWNVSVDGLSVEMGWRNRVGYMNRLTPAVDAVEEFPGGIGARITLKERAMPVRL